MNAIILLARPARLASPRLRGPATATRAMLAAVAMLAMLLAAACESPPPLKINYDLSKGPAQACPMQTCEAISVACNAVLSIRIVDPAQPRTADGEDNALVSVCQKIDSRTLCGMQQVNLPADTQLPARRLAVQVALYNADEISGSEGDGPLECPADLRFDANNFAIAGDLHPAVAGQGYFSPGDAETTVQLGCSDLSVINTPTCRGDDRFQVTASADDFDTGVFLQPPVAENVALLVGEPKGSLDSDSQLRYRLPLDSLTPLKMLVGRVPPAWSAEVEDPFIDSVCVVVDEKTSESTSSASCQRLDPDKLIDLRGLRLARSTLITVLAALQHTSFPKKGLVVGMVVDWLGNPAKDVQVRSSSGTVKYLSEGRDRITGTSTSSTGIFLSEDALYTTSWSAPGTTGGYGGLIQDHVTVVILQPPVAQQP